jgi:HD superfamily phosphohydrolase
MKLYAEKPTSVLWIVGITISVLFMLLKDSIFQRYGTSPLRGLKFVEIALIVLILAFTYNTIAIWLSRPRELHTQMVKRWMDFTDNRCTPSLWGRADDCVDRTASLLIWLKARALLLGEIGVQAPGVSPSLRDAELNKQVAHYRSELADLKSSNLPVSMSILGSVWKQEKGAAVLPDVIFREDPIYGQLQLDSRLIPLFFHPMVQRLNYIRQLSFAYLTFPSASHTRLSHILGVVRNAETAIQTIFNKGWVYTSKGRERIDLGREDCDRFCLKAQLCALLHDIGHGPFGHALDKPLMAYSQADDRNDVPDKLFSAKYVEEVLAKEIASIGFSVAEVLSILDKERRADLSGYDVLVADVVDSPVDVDRMDYLARDAHMTGLSMGHSHPQALIEHMCPFRDQQGNVTLTYEESALPHLEHLVYAHDMMYINCYEHWRKLCAERLLTRLAEYLLRSGVTKESLMLLTDGQLLAALSLAVADGSAEKEYLRSLHHNCNFYAVVPAYSLSTLEWDAQRSRLIPTFNKELGADVEGWYRNRAKGRAYYKQLFVNQPAQWEELICAEAEIAELERWKVVVTVPAYDAKQAQESGASVLVKATPGYHRKDLFEASAMLAAVITNLIPLREVIHVLVSEDLPQSAAARIPAAANHVFKKA